MGHIAPNTAKCMIEKGFVVGVHLNGSSSPPVFCESCVYAKATHKSVLKEREGKRADELGGEIHTDVWGPTPIPTIWGRQYYVSFIDDNTWLAHITLMHNKGKTFQAYRDFEAYLHLQYSKNVIAINSNRGGKYMGKSFVLYLQKASTCRKLNVHNTPQHAGVSKHFNRTIVERIHAMLHASRLPRFLWGEAAHHATWLINCTPTRVHHRSHHRCHTITPYLLPVTLHL
jgi:hypothetical protein